MTCKCIKRFIKENITWLCLLNYILLQWFFIRLAKSGRWINGKFIVQKYIILKGIYPLTGWTSSYKYIGKR